MTNAERDLSADKRMRMNDDNDWICDTMESAQIQRWQCGRSSRKPTIYSILYKCKSDNGDGILQAHRGAPPARGSSEGRDV